jgi:hypothetical protein
MRFHRSLLVSAGAAFLAGCASGGAKFNSQTDMSGSPRIQRVLVYYNAKSAHFSGTLYSTFVAGTQRRLESCGVSVTTLEFDPLDLDMRKKIATTLERSKPDAMLTVVRNGGNLTTGSGGTSGSLYFDVEATSKRDSKKLWKARIDYRVLTANLFADDNQSGERFAAQFVARMAADGLVQGCPTEVVNPKA